MQSEDGGLEERLHERDADASGNMSDHVSSFTGPMSELEATIIYQAVLGSMVFHKIHLLEHHFYLVKALFLCRSTKPSLSSELRVGPTEAGPEERREQ